MKSITKVRIASAGFWTGVVLLVFGLLGRAGLLEPQNVVPGILVAAAVIGVGVLVPNYLFGKARFTVGKRPDDPGHYNMPKSPAEVYSRSGRTGWVRFQDWPATYIRDAPGSQRFQFAWETPSRQFRTIQFKFATLIVGARWNDALEVQAHASIRVLDGAAEGTALNVWMPLGLLNWFSEKVMEEIKRPEPSGGELDFPVLNLIYDHPGLGLNRYLANPKTTIVERTEADLPLFYMREGWPHVYLCGASQGVDVSPEAEGVPVRFEIEVTISGIKSRPAKVRFKASAKWDDLRLEPSEAE